LALALSVAGGVDHAKVVEEAGCTLLQRDVHTSVRLAEVGGTSVPVRAGLGVWRNLALPRLTGRARATEGARLPVRSWFRHAAQCFVATLVRAGVLVVAEHRRSGVTVVAVVTGVSDAARISVTAGATHGRHRTLQRNAVACLWLEAPVGEGLTDLAGNDGAAHPVDRRPSSDAASLAIEGVAVAARRVATDPVCGYWAGCVCESEQIVGERVRGRERGGGKERSSARNHCFDASSWHRWRENLLKGPSVSLALIQVSCEGRVLILIGTETSNRSPSNDECRPKLLVMGPPPIGLVSVVASATHAPLMRWKVRT
jgi:hypothetical protein